ncbi:uncharacterized protein LOC128724947 [Anopheles nili]|uniref:uncharacterized protein LOC128724947 n=1 Tax=Anopheles nili TaxID=185578 RepID=UPI00237BD719|nr:uncharacterized protein LOC128724947 [Anopheles nili]
MTTCVPAHMMDAEQHFHNSIDLDAEQTEARYDQEMLSDIINDNDRGELQKAESCLVDDYKYDHGQKIQRLDPCEICLCIDGEIFCWWKQCDTVAKTSLDTDQQFGSSHTALKADQTSSESFAEASTATSMGNSAGVSTAKSKPSFDASPEIIDSSNSATWLTFADSLSDGGTTSISSTLPISTPSSRSQDSDRAPSDTVTHYGTVHTSDAIEGIPKNVLSFPQTPPIMMYRPGAVGPVASREGKPLDGARKAKLSTLAGARKTKGSTAGRKKSKDRKKSPQKLNAPGDGGYSFELDRKPTVAIASDALPKVPATSKDVVRAPEESPRIANQDDKIPQSHEQQTSTQEQQQFGGYGFGMIREPDQDRRPPTASRSHDRDVPQHYIITSSGHVEMFDDTGTMGGLEVGSETQSTPPRSPGDSYEKAQYRDVLSFDGRVSSRVVQEQPPNGSAGEDSDAMDSDEGEEDSEGEQRSEEGEAVAPAIMLTTNVTQGKFSLGEGLPSMPVPGASASVIDILNSTTLETDYGEGTNHTELIYPEVPSIGSGSSSSSSSSTIKPPTNTEQSEQHCIVMGVTYPVGAVLKQETGNCLQCVCVAGPENDPAPRVTCTPLNCPPLILPDILDGAGF